MSDELDLAFGEAPDQTPRGHRRKRSGGRSAAAFVLVLLLFGLLGGGAWYGYGKVKDFFTAADYAGPGSNPVQVEIKTNDTLTDMGNTLVGKDVVKSAAAFIQAAEKNSKSKNIQVGFYTVKQQMSGEQAVTALLDPKNRVVRGVTIPEGLTYLETFAKLAEQTKIPVDQFQAAAKDPIALGLPDWWFNRTDGKQARKDDIEGFLYPQTYEFPPNADATAILRTMIGHFNEEMEKLGFVAKVQKERGISPYEALIAASIAQREAMHNEDMGSVIRVLYNRVYTGKFPCNCLQIDSAVNYWLSITGKGAKPSEQLLKSELHNKTSPYNTHDTPGMPAGPIGNPGEAALKGAMDPPPSDNLFFVSIDTKGTMAYAKTNAEFEQKKQIACKNGVPICNIK